MDFNRELVDNFASGNGVLFVGAGLSIGGGLCSWNDLMKPLRAELRAERANRGQPADDVDDLPPLQLAQSFADEISRNHLINVLRDNLPRFRGSPTGVHEALFKLPVREIYTTNFDHLIENTAERIQRPYQRVIRREHADDVHPMGPDGSAPVRIVKIHGDYDDKDQIIISQDDYDRVEAVKGDIWADMNRMFSTKTVLFLGYSFNDPDLENLIEKVRKRAGRFPRNVFAVHFDGWPIDAKRLGKLGVHLVRLRLNRLQTANEALAEWMNAFAAEVARRSIKVEPPQPIPHNLPPALPLVGRTDELRALLPALEWERSCIPLSGTVGVGKTSLALAAAHACARDNRLFDYVVWLFAREHTNETLLPALLTAVERTTGYDLGPAVDDPGPFSSRREAQLLSLLQHHRLLIVIDHLNPRAKDADLAQLLSKDLGLSRILLTTGSKEFDGGAVLEGFSDLGAVQFFTALVRAGPRDHPLAEANDARLEEFARAFNGNPMFLKLAFHLAQDPAQVQDLIEKCRGQPEAEISELLHQRIWERLPPDGQDLLKAARLFEIGLIDGRALSRVSRLHYRFKNAVEDCRRFGVVEVIEGRESDSVRIHPITLNFVGRHLQRLDPEKAKEEREEGRRRFVAYYSELVERCAKRAEPSVRYWNALVSDRMRELDPEWPNIRLAAHRCAEAPDKSQFLQFVMLLVHYMDSRLYNIERLRSVHRAANLFAEEKGDWEAAALLRLDALAWTYMEQGQLNEAEQQIKEGLGYVEKLNGQAREDLYALGQAWLSRLALERNDLAGAEKLAMLAVKRQCSPWIETRLQLAVGDVAFRQDKGAKALRLYNEAVALARDHGFEEAGYDLLPRIGLALLRINDLKGARLAFRELGGASEVPVARLYSEYGLGLADHQERNSLEARRSVADAERELVERNSRRLLLKAFKQQYERQREAHGSRFKGWICLAGPPKPEAFEAREAKVSKPAKPAKSRPAAATSKPSRGRRQGRSDQSGGHIGAH